MNTMLCLRFDSGFGATSGYEVLPNKFYPVHPRNPCLISSQTPPK